MSIRFKKLKTEAPNQLAAASQARQLAYSMSWKDLMSLSENCQKTTYYTAFASKLRLNLSLIRIVRINLSNNNANSEAK